MDEHKVDAQIKTVNVSIKMDASIIKIDIEANGETSTMTMAMTTTTKKIFTESLSWNLSC